jgi:dTDP-4-amino-4,6-dideoxygalactose transaminase
MSASTHGKESIGHFPLDFAQPDALPAASAERISELLANGRLFRYQGVEKSSTEENNVALEVSWLEQEFAATVGSKFAMATNSCGSAMFLALKAAGVRRGDAVLVNTFTLHPVPSAIVHAGARPVFVESDDTLRIDLHDLEAKARSSNARWLLLSHMRGHTVDFDKLLALCRRCDIRLIEDCAHSLGGQWNGNPVGSFGVAACFSFQTNKLVNAGEGGMVTTNNEEIAARVILHSGSYGLFKQSGAVMGPNLLNLDILEKFHNITPNYSMRMTNLTAALVRTQLPLMQDKIERFNSHYAVLQEELQDDPLFTLTASLEREQRVHTSLQFSLAAFDLAQMDYFCELCKEHGVTVAWFGRPTYNGFTSALPHWEYVFQNQVHPGDAITKADSALPNTTRILEKLFDIPLYHTSSWGDGDFRKVASILRACANLAKQKGVAARL